MTTLDIAASLIRQLEPTATDVEVPSIFQGDGTVSIHYFVDGQQGRWDITEAEWVLLTAASTN